MESVRSLLESVVFSYQETNIALWQLLLVPLVIVLGYMMLRWLVAVITRALQTQHVTPDAVQAIRRAIYIIGLLILFLTLLDLINVPLTAFAFVSGAIAIGIGFGAQNVINNFISGWILMWERPIRIGDFIELEGTSGTVQEINTRSTKIRRVDGVHMLVPNSKLLEETVVNWTLVDRLIRTTVRVGVAYGSPINEVKEILAGIVNDHAEILADPPPQVIFEDFGDSSLVFDTYFWVMANADKTAREIRSEVRFEIDRLFRENRIEIAYPQRDLHVDGELRITQ